MRAHHLSLKHGCKEFYLPVPIMTRLSALSNFLPAGVSSVRSSSQPMISDEGQPLFYVRPLSPVYKQEQQRLSARLSIQHEISTDI